MQYAGCCLQNLHSSVSLVSEAHQFKRCGTSYNRGASYNHRTCNAEPRKNQSARKPLSGPTRRQISVPTTTTPPKPQPQGETKGCARPTSRGAGARSRPRCPPLAARPFPSLPLPSFPLPARCVAMWRRRYVSARQLDGFRHYKVPGARRQPGCSPPAPLRAKGRGRAAGLQPGGGARRAPCAAAGWERQGGGKAGGKEAEINLPAANSRPAGFKPSGVS